MRNSIRGIRDSLAQWQVQLEEVEKVLIEFYVELYTSSNLGSYPKTSAHVAHLVIVEMNEIGRVHGMGSQCSFKKKWHHQRPLF